MIDTDTERMTEELLERLLASATPEAYLEQGQTIDYTLPAYLQTLLKAHNVNRADVIRASGINGTVVYDIFAGKSKPGRDHAIMLSLGLGCTLKECQRLLRLVGVSGLWCKSRRDAVVIWCIEQGLSRAQTDDELYRLGEKTLLSTGRLR